MVNAAEPLLEKRSACMRGQPCRRLACAAQGNGCRGHPPKVEAHHHASQTPLAGKKPVGLETLGPPSTAQRPTKTSLPPPPRWSFGNGRVLIRIYTWLQNAEHRNGREWTSAAHFRRVAAAGAAHRQHRALSTVRSAPRLTRASKRGCARCSSLLHTVVARAMRRPWMIPRRSGINRFATGRYTGIGVGNTIWLATNIPARCDERLETNSTSS